MSLPKETQAWVLTHKTTGTPTTSGDKPTFTIQTQPLPELKQDQVLVKLLYLSNDPAQRTWISPVIDESRHYTTIVRDGSVMRARGLCELLASNSKTFKSGDKVLVSCGWTQYSVQPASACTPAPPLPKDLSLTHYLGALGLTGHTAYYGLVDVARATPADTVVVSGAAGATGSMVVQIARHLIGCKKVVGMAGSDDKCRWVEGLGADVCLNYKARNFQEELVKATDGFVEVFFDNVGGEILDLMLARMKRNGRIAACGVISAYNQEGGSGTESGTKMKNLFQIVGMRLEIRGFIVLDDIQRQSEIIKVFQRAVKDGKLKIDEDSETVVKGGFEDIPKTWLRLFEGGNQGKLITELA